MKNTLLSFLLIVTLFACFPFNTSAYAAKYHDVGSTFLATADYMENEPNNSAEDADQFELGKSVGGTVLVSNQFATESESFDYFFLPMKKGNIYVLTLSLKNKEDKAFISSSFLLEGSDGKRMLLSEIADKMLHEKNPPLKLDILEHNEEHMLLLSPNNDSVLFYYLWCPTDNLGNNTKYPVEIPYKIHANTLTQNDIQGLQDMLQTELDKRSKEKPGINDMSGCDSRVVVPNSGSWLSDYSKKTIKSSLGNGIILRYMPDSEFSYDGYNNLDFLPDGTSVTELARQNGFSLIKCSDGQVGWVQTKHLV